MINDSLSHFAAFAIVLTFVFFSLGLLSLVRKYSGSSRFDGLIEYAETFSDAIGIVFTVIVAFVAITVWQNYDKVEDDVRKESGTLNTLYNYIGAYPEQFSRAIQPRIRLYMEQVIKVEWPMLADQHEDPVAHAMIYQINQDLLLYNPANNKEIVMHQETVRKMGDYLERRNERLVNSHPNMTTPLWIILVGGVMLYLFFLCLLDVPTYRHHAIMIGTFGGFMGLVFFVLIAYNFPFQNPNCIKPDAMEAVLASWK